MAATIIPLGRLAPDSPVAEIPRVGPVQQRLLAKLGIVTVRDLLYHLPFRYEDTRELTPLARLQAGEVQTSRVSVTGVSGPRVTPRRRMLIVEASFEDSSGRASAVWFGKQFVERRLHEGDRYLISGSVRRERTGLQFVNPKFEEVKDDQQHVGTLAAVYHETEKLSSVRLREFVSDVIDTVAPRIDDVLPPKVRSDERLPSIAEALRMVHLPADGDEAREGRARITFERVFVMSAAAARARRRRMSSRGIVIPYEVSIAREFSASLPFKLTDDQRVAAHQILNDMAAPGPMSRLLQGDVGSGKTVVAALAALMTRRAGRQTAIMAPTEILARQHAATLNELLTPHGLPPRLLVGSTGERARREIIGSLAAGYDALIVGTHALIEDDVVMGNLGLAVVDEQHRFGVRQRQLLRQKSGDMPNFLAMTATPIPRSLQLTMYGDIDVSEIRQMPHGRLPVRTQVVSPVQRDEAYAFVRDQIRAGRQTFVICPLIEESDKLGAKSATAEFERLQRDVFPDLRIELLHGRMPAREKEARMARFATGEADILVSTSVVEVGVDVPNASVMLIEGAERFGLAQLHQFRGRVGRGQHQSYCLLFESSAIEDDDAPVRLAAMAATTSGFELAELDLDKRGPGDIAGLRQHGAQFEPSDLLDRALVNRARAAAERHLATDGDLALHPPLAAALQRYGEVFDLD